MALMPCESTPTDSKKNIVSNLSVTIIDKTYMVGGRATGSYSLTGSSWNTIQTITDNAYKPTSDVYGISVDGAGVTRPAKVETDGKISVYAISAGTAANFNIVINDVTT